ncbi:MAG: ArsR family transcriptional regulator [Anaerolineales bacterium]|nr:ArsR family transcriptional regulator [Anaerolineales bacterium]
MTPKLHALATLDRTIHEPARLMLVMLLSAVKSADFLFLERETGLTKGNLSAHLSKLEKAGYVSIQKTFKGKYPLTTCSLTPQGRQAFAAYRGRLEAALQTNPLKNSAKTP